MKIAFKAFCDCGVFTSFGEGWKPTPAHEKSKRHQAHVEWKRQRERAMSSVAASCPEPGGDEQP
jgi:hypothetical protein